MYSVACCLNSTGESVNNFTRSVAAYLQGKKRLLPVYMAFNDTKYPAATPNTAQKRSSFTSPPGN